MTKLIQLWREQSDFFINKTFAQIINIAGEGQLKDNNETSNQVREEILLSGGSLLFLYR